MSLEHWWNDMDRGKQKYWEKTPSECHSFHHISLWTGLRPNPGLHNEKPVTIHLSHFTPNNLMKILNNVFIVL
jgi:hypothetical protein